MNQVKIGKFIAELRKEKSMTQKELAEKLNITDRAVSKWENGRGLPELSLIKPLSEELDISINELLSGERVPQEEYQEKFEENIINTINYTGTKISRAKTAIIVLACSIILIVGALYALFRTDMLRMGNNEEVVYSTWGYDYAPPVGLNEARIELAIEKYLVDEQDRLSDHHDNEKWFAAIKTFLIVENEAKVKFIVYAWALEESCYYKDGEIAERSGSSVPYKITVEVIDGEYTVTKCEAPGDGGDYTKDINRLFPEEVRDKVYAVHTDGTVEELETEIKKQAILYFSDN